MAKELPKQSFVYVGTYTAKGAQGVHLCRFDAASGELAHAGLAAEMPNPSFLAIQPQKRFLYAVSEVRGAGGRRGGAVHAFAIAPHTGQLTFLNQQSSQGTGPCHLCVDRAGQHVLVANYASGSVAILPIHEDGQLGEATDKVQHEGTSINAKRQEGPHAHSVTLSPDNRFALVADLGIDRIMVYRLDVSQGRLVPNEPPWKAVKPGAGPRHMAFHPGRPVVYLINELDNTMIVFAWDASRGALRELQAISTLPADFHGTSYCADVQTDPTGTFLYGSNRGHDSIAIFAIDERNGGLSKAGHQSTLGKWPRNFAIDSSGKWLIAANQESDSVVLFRIDPASGQLSPADRSVTISMPVCVRILQAQ